MYREYFKPIKKSSRFRTFMKAYGADYIEDGTAVFKIPKIYGSTRIAFGIEEAGDFSIGIINESCDNYEKTKIVGCAPQEAEWLLKILPIVAKWKKDKNKK